MLDNKIVFDRLKEKFGEEIYGYEENFGLMSVYANKEMNLKILQFLFEEVELGFQFLTDLTAVHYPKRDGEELTVTYLVLNMKQNFRLRLNFSIPIEKPFIYTATKIFEASNWLERECYDFYGVNFIGHPNLIRVMNVPEMDYFPLRKEYPLEDQTRTDKDDEMFGRGGKFNFGKFTV